MAETARSQKALLEELNEMKAQSAAARRPHEGQWLLNVAFFHDQQWVWFDGHKLMDVELLSGQSRPVDNRLKLHTRTSIARQTKQRPVFTGQPGTLDQADIESAMLGEEIFEYEWGERDFSAQLRLALWWRYLCGAGWWKMTWDSTGGQEMRAVFLDPDGKPLRDPQTGRLVFADQDNDPAVQALKAAGVEPVEQKLFTGEPLIDVRSPFQIYPDVNASQKGVQSCGWIIDESVQDPQILKDRYPDYADKIQPDADAGMSTLGPRSGTMPGFKSAGGKKTGVKTYELWQLPNGEHKRGRNIVWTETCILEVNKEGNPYPWLPYDRFAGDPSGEFHPLAPATPLISPQIRLNKRIQQIDDNADRFANPVLMYPSNIREEMEAWGGEVGEHLAFDETNPEARPEFMRMPELPSLVDREIDRSIDSMREIAGQNEASTGLVPPGVTAASAINLIQEANDTQLGPDIEAMEQTLQKAGEKWMWLLAQYADDERILAISGEDGDWDIRTWRSQQLQGNWHLRVQAGSGLPRSKAAKQAAMSQMLDLFIKYGGGPGALDQRNLRRFLSEYEIGALERMFADIAVDERKVSREHRRMVLGTQVLVHPRDNHELEIAIHNEFRKTPRFERLAAVNPAFAQAHEAHIAAHEAEIQKAADLALVKAGAQVQPMPGSPGSAQNSQPGMNGNSPPSSPPSAQVPSLSTPQ